MNWNPAYNTGATNAALMGLINAIMGLAVAFNLPLTDSQQGSIIAVANAFMVVFVLLTRQNSPSRTGDVS